MHVHIIHRWEFFFKQVLAGLTAHGRRPQQVVFPFLVIVHKKKKETARTLHLTLNRDASSHIVVASFSFCLIELCSLGWLLTDGLTLLASMENLVTYFEAKGNNTSPVFSSDMHLAYCTKQW